VETYPYICGRVVPCELNYTDDKIFSKNASMQLGRKKEVLDDFH
jgi:hypothetical protein